MGGISGEADADILAYKCMPKAGFDNKGIAAEEHTLSDPFDKATTKPRLQKFDDASKASFKFTTNWEQLPTLHHILSRLAKLPVYGIVGAKVVESIGVPDVSTVGPIE
jgi:hypothetical protein